MKAVCLLLCLALARYTAGHIFPRQYYPGVDSLVLQPVDFINQEIQDYPQQQSQEQASQEQQNQRDHQHKHRRQQHHHRQQNEHQQQSQYRQQNQQTQSQSYEQQNQKQQRAYNQQQNEQYQQKEQQSKGRYQPQSQEQHQQQSQESAQQQSMEQFQQQSNEQNQQQTKRQTQQQSNEQYQQQSNEQNQQQPHKQYQKLSSVQYQQQTKKQNQQQSKAQYQQKNKQRYSNKVASKTHNYASSESNSEETSRDGIIQYATPVFADVQEMTRSYTRSQKQAMQPAHGDVIAWRDVRIADGPNTRVNKQDIENIFNEAYKTMMHLTEDDKQIFHQSYQSAVNENNEDVHLNASQLLNKYQYPAEKYTVKTDDGYNLTVFRMLSKEPTLDQQKPVVFLMHGILGSADDWLLMGPGKSLAYLLVDAGYEVWLGNARGNKYSRRHVSKHPAQNDFWQFSTDEIALHDLPAMIDFALQTSRQEKLYYIGYSQGTTAFFALAAERPEYNDKIIMMHALSPMAYMSNVRSPMLRMIAPNNKFNELLHHLLGHGEFKPSKELIRTVGGAICEEEIGCPNVCSNAQYVMTGANVADVDVNLLPVVMAHLPAGGSSRQVKQYAQAVASREFTKYDYGSEINQMVYGTSQPPKYDMQKVVTPVSLYYSEDDWLAHPTDVERLAKELNNVSETYKIPQQHFSNMDFQFSKNAPAAVYNRLIESIKNQQIKQQQQQQQNYVF